MLQQSWQNIPGKITNCILSLSFAGIIKISLILAFNRVKVASSALYKECHRPLRGLSEVNPSKMIINVVLCLVTQVPLPLVAFCCKN